MLRAIRIIGTATLLAFLFRLSQAVGEEWGNRTVEGYTVAVGCVGVLFLIRAAASEFASTRVHLIQRDILWGLSLGAFVTVLARLTAS